MSAARGFATLVLVGVFVFVADLFVFWFFWAAADAVPAVQAAVWRRIAWPIISFPVFSFTTKNFATAYFWELAVLNVSLWACATAFLAWKVNNRSAAR
jgi:hypothetical protein